MYCPNCGKEISKESRFCKFCGNSVSIETSLVENIPQSVIDKKPEKLDGWVILVFLGLVYGTIVTAVAVYSSLKLFNDGTINLLNDPSLKSYIPGYTNAVSIEIIGQVIYIVVGLFLGYLFFKRNKNFPKFYICLLIYLAIFYVIDYLLISSLNSSNPEVQTVLNNSLADGGAQIGRALIGAGIWIPYMLSSKKIKAVFIKNN